MTASPRISPRKAALRAASSRTEVAAPPAPDGSPWDAYFHRAGLDPHRATLWAVIVLTLTVAAFSVAPVLNNLRGLQNKDYNLWYWTARTYDTGYPIYPRDNRPFPFMYPPSCAALFAPISRAGEQPFVEVLLIANTGAWIGSILLSVSLATGRALRQHPLLYLAPTLVVIPFVHDMYLLGQPSLVLFVCLLGAFACLRGGRPWAAGGLIATASAIKAFPILAVGYLVWRRQWKATAATVLFLALWLIVVPLPIRGPGQAWDDLRTWTRGMVLKYDRETIAQRPERSYSFKNQSLIALSNRLLRSIPADGERKDGWQVNVASLDFRTTNAAIVAVSLGLCGFYVLTMPRAARRTETTDAVETSMLLLLILAFCPLSFDYSFVWLISPLTVALHLYLEAPPGSRDRANRMAWVVAVVVLLALGLPFRRVAQAYGNLLVADVVLLVALGWQMRLAARPPAGAVAVAGPVG